MCSSYNCSTPYKPLWLPSTNAPSLSDSARWLPRLLPDPDAHRLAAPQPAQLREPARGEHRLAGTGSVNQLASVNLLVQVVRLLQPKNLQVGDFA